MHLAVLNRSMFDVQKDGSPASLDDVFPDFTDLDRVGVVVRTPYGGMGVSHLVVMAVIEHYRARRGSGEIYPDFFLFRVGKVGDHSMLDIWPPHHQVDVPDDAESILQAVNDRGITRLLVEVTEPGAPKLDNWTERSALGRLATTIVFDPSGQVADPDVVITASKDVEREIGLQLDPEAIVRESEGYDDFLAYYAQHRDDVPADVTADLRRAREASAAGGRRTESYRLSTTEQTLRMLSTA